MKKPIAVLFLLTLFAVPSKLLAQSESYTPWQINFSLGYAAASGEGVKGGVALHFEPQYHLNDNISLGLRFGVAVLLKVAANENVGGVTADYTAAAVKSYLATGNYYFQKSGWGFRPFVGIGLGYSVSGGFTTKTATSTKTPAGSVNIDQEINVADASGFGGLARLGFDVNHFRFNVEYAINPKTKNDLLEITSNYVGINIGLYFGGGLKK